MCAYVSVSTEIKKQQWKKVKQLNLYSADATLVVLLAENERAN